MALAKDMSKELRGRLQLDASAAIGIIEGRGLANVRHVYTDMLGLQEAVAQRKLHAENANGTDNLADLIGKHVGVATTTHYMCFMHLYLEAGQPAAAAAIVHSIDRSAVGDTWISRGTAEFGWLGPGRGGLSSARPSTPATAWDPLCVFFLSVSLVV